MGFRLIRLFHATVCSRSITRIQTVCEEEHIYLAFQFYFSFSE